MAELAPPLSHGEFTNWGDHRKGRGAKLNSYSTSVRGGLFALTRNTEEE